METPSSEGELQRLSHPRRARRPSARHRDCARCRSTCLTLRRWHGAPARKRRASMSARLDDASTHLMVSDLAHEQHGRVLLGVADVDPIR